MRFDAPHEEVLATLARELGANSYLEIGVQEGRSLEAALSGFQGLCRLLVLCDDWGRNSGGSGRGSHDHVEALLRRLGRDDGAIYLDGRSQECLPQWAADNPQARFALVHVDGEHSYEGALADLRNAWPLCLSAMVVHDISMPNVWSACIDFCKEAAGVNRASIFAGGHGTVVFHREGA